jgi:glycogen debranching enzyme
MFALAIDGDKRQVDSLTSNIGHLLWSGIVDDDKAVKCVGHLMGDRLFSGWGIRTMAVGDAAYNPIGYHVGTIWPHDNSIIAWGLRRYGYRKEAAKISLASSSTPSTDPPGLDAMKTVLRTRHTRVWARTWS